MTTVLATTVILMVVSAATGLGLMKLSMWRARRRKAAQQKTGATVAYRISNIESPNSPVPLSSVSSNGAAAH